MFFNSGKTCPATHEFIANKIGGSSEQVTRRYNEFYLVSAFITSEADWDQSSLGDLLSAIDDLEKNNTHAGLKHKFFITKLDIIFQIGLSVLREIINLEHDALPEDPAEFVIPNQISVAAYRNKIEALLEKHRSYYIEEETGDLHAKFPHHLEDLVTNVVQEENANGKSKRGAKKAVLNGRKVYELLEEHRVNVFTQSIVKFIQSVEEKVLPIPLDVGCYAAATGESLTNTLRRLSNQHHHRDWTDAEAEAHGPYTQQGESSARKQRAGSEHEVPAVATSSTRSKSSGNAKNAPLSPVFAESAPASPAHAAPAAKRGRKGANAKNKKDASEDEEAATADEEVAVVSQKFKRKYEESDPLLFMGEASSPAKARARVSREAELPPASSSKQLSSGQKSASKATTSSNAAASAQGKKKLFQSGVHKKGEKVDFSDSEEVDSVYDEESDVASDEGRSVPKGAVAQLLSLKRSHPKVNGKFPAKLDSPAKASKNGKNAKKGTTSSAASNNNGKVDKVTLAAQSNAIIAAGQRQKWNFEQETILAEAVGRYGEGNWQAILHDPEYAIVFVGRTNVNLKDKWRNMQKAANK